MPRRSTLNISLTPTLTRFVSNKVDSGRYQSASEVIREALRLMEETESLPVSAKALFRKQIDDGWKQAQQGQLLDGAAVFDKLTRSKKKSRTSTKTPTRKRAA